MINNHQINEKLTWVEVISPNEDEAQLLIDQGLTQELIFYATDPNEAPRLEIDNHNKLALVIWDVLTPDDHPESSPVGFIFDQNNRLYTFAREATAFVGERLQADNQQEFPAKSKRTAIDLFLNGIYSLTADYVSAVNGVNRKRNNVQTNLQERINKTAINDLMWLETSSIYLSDSLNSHAYALKSLKDYWTLHQKMTPAQLEHLNDIQVENNQAYMTAKQANDIISAISDAYNNLSNTALNTSMQVLTIIQLIMSVPTVITGFYGMNMYLPVADKSWSWIFAVGLTLVIVGLGTWVLKKLNYFNH